MEEYESFQGVEDDFHRVKDRQFQTLGFFIMGSLYTMEDFADFIDILINI